MTRRTRILGFGLKTLGESPTMTPEKMKGPHAGDGKTTRSFVDAVKVVFKSGSEKTGQPPVPRTHDRNGNRVK